MLFLGIDWAGAHHDVVAMAEDGAVLAEFRVGHDVEGLGTLHGRVAGFATGDEAVVVGIEIDHGLLVESLVAAGYELYPVNPLSVARYRDRHGLSGAKSDRADAKLLADLVRTDRHNHRPLAVDSGLAVGIKAIARAHKRLCWDRQLQANRLRDTLVEYYPAAL